MFTRKFYDYRKLYTCWDIFLNFRRKSLCGKKNSAKLVLICIFRVKRVSGMSGRFKTKKISCKKHGEIVEKSLLLN